MFKLSGVYALLLLLLWCGKRISRFSHGLWDLVLHSGPQQLPASGVYRLGELFL